MRAEPGRSNPPTSSPLHPLEKTNGWSQNEPIGGSILDAGNPAKGVNFARRFTLSRKPFQVHRRRGWCQSRSAARGLKRNSNGSLSRGTLSCGSRRRAGRRLHTAYFVRNSAIETPSRLGGQWLALHLREAGFVPWNWLTEETRELVGV